jgi:hypothetical protein
MTSVVIASEAKQSRRRMFQLGRILMWCPVIAAPEPTHLSERGFGSDAFETNVDGGDADFPQRL